MEINRNDCGEVKSIRLSVIILSYNEEVNLPACLDSLKGLQCDIFVVDSGSTDRTVGIAKGLGAKVVQHPFEDYGAQRNWAQENLDIEADWILHLDADERLTPELVGEINEVLGHTPSDVGGFLLRKRTIFMGRWISHGGHYPSYHLRLFRRGQGVCEDRLYDQHFIVTGKTVALKHDYVDILTSDLTTWTLRHARWAGLEAEEILAGRNNGSRVKGNIFGGPIEQRRWLREGLYARCPLFVRAFLYWFYRYFCRLGFLDGKEGLIFHFLQGLWYRFLVDAKIYEHRRRFGNEPGAGPRGERL